MEREWTAAQIALELNTSPNQVLRTLHEHDIPVRRGGPLRPRTDTPSQQRLAALYDDPDVAALLRRHDIPVRTEGGTITQRFSEPAEISGAFLVEAYAEIGLSAAHIEQLTGQSAERVLALLREHGVPVLPSAVLPLAPFAASLQLSAAALSPPRATLRGSLRGDGKGWCSGGRGDHRLQLHSFAGRDQGRGHGGPDPRRALGQPRDGHAARWEIGRLILDRQDTEGWGTKVISRLSTDLRTEFPGMRGFGTRSLVYMRTMARAYPHGIAQGPLAQLPWSHITVLLDKVPDPQARAWYAAQDVQHGWSAAVLTHHITTTRHKRVGMAPNNFPQVLPPNDSDQTREILQDPYALDFLALNPRHSERDLEDALVARLTRFLSELGTGFAFVGQQHKVTVGSRDYYIDCSSTTSNFAGLSSSS